jgi:hypothetical protein
MLEGVLIVWISWPQWQAQELNQILHGGAITEETVRSGERIKRSSNQLTMMQGFSKQQLRRTTKRQWKGLAAQVPPPAPEPTGPDSSTIQGKSA